MKLTGANVALSATESRRADLSIRRGRLSFESSGEDASEVDLSGHLILPGLINAHDHLEFSLFPRLGRGPYPNATAWASDIYRPGESPLKEHLSIPKAIRLEWGGLKNLLSGVTTVGHHNPYEPEVFSRGFPVRVVRRFAWAHSLHFSPNLAARFHEAPRHWPFIVHAAEGTDCAARSEIFRLDEHGVLSRRTVLVHATGIHNGDLSLIRKRGCSIVWCPSSNLFTLGVTLNAEVLGSGTPVALGTDSSLTAEGSLADEMRVAQNVSQLPREEIYSMVTERAAAILRLSRGEGTLREGGVADLVAVRDRHCSPAAALPWISPELVIVGGAIKLVSVRLAPRLPLALIRRLRPVELEGRGRWLVDANVPLLYAAAEHALGPGFRLGGRRVGM